MPDIPETISERNKRINRELTEKAMAAKLARTKAATEPRQATEEPAPAPTATPETSEEEEIKKTFRYLKK